jgi:hypothetical protein
MQWYETGGLSLEDGHHPRRLLRDADVQIRRIRLYAHIPGFAKLTSLTWLLEGFAYMKEVVFLTCASYSKVSSKDTVRIFV